ncbi:hypothetical protein J5N97_017715 [Dioscorea zingiberensis]|uniref:PNPLA domain-containing protein n=1 Tax=Dioscorea zingiberensis TaxID=325984 RepID=A0A9D5HGM5_9LILI|nr:hypothetical protein J5N97_017715 [Dioscorea zingiberensis]
MAAWMKPSVDMDKLSYEIFSILETKFLFGCDDDKLGSIAGTPPETPSKPGGSSGKVRILSIDGGGASDGLFAAVSLTRLETSLRRRSGDPSVRIADFFDLASGSGPGGVLAALLFSRGPNGRPLFSAEEALAFLSENLRRISNAASKKGIFWKRSGIFGRIFGDRTVRDALKPMLIPCHDLETGAGMMFSRADAVEMDGYDFLMKDVCAATCAGDQAVAIRSVDGLTKISAVGAGVGNPTAAAITHVLNNKQEFPRANGVEDLLVLSLGGGRGASPPSKAKARQDRCGWRRRHGEWVEGQGKKTRAGEGGGGGGGADGEERGGCIVPGSKLSERTNAERLENFAGELIREEERRKWSTEPTVVIKRGSPMV